jgi:hypothetical protein
MVDCIARIIIGISPTVSGLSPANFPLSNDGDTVSLNIRKSVQYDSIWPSGTPNKSILAFGISGINKVSKKSYIQVSFDGEIKIQNLWDDVRSAEKVYPDLNIWNFYFSESRSG